MSERKLYVKPEIVVKGYVDVVGRGESFELARRNLQEKMRTTTCSFRQAVRELKALIDSY
ncbi:MAG: hypothetical protein HY513_03730 [Candidatus Aenigmarchaeota archaeon]|nr:hypothetical protein [Candidatus Aenigmarchaeota archaeon]